MSSSSSADVILEVLISMVVADEDVDPDELDTLQRVYQELTEQTVDVEEIRARARARLGTDDPTAFAPDLADKIAPPMRAKLLAGAVAIAEADGFVLDEEDEQLTRLAEALGMPSDAHRRAAG